MTQDLPISVRGARQFNLAGIDIDIPRNTLTVLCGPSGSGKSTLAIDTLYAESRRRFLDCMSPKFRQSMHLPDKPDVDSIAGLPPSLCLDQSRTSYGPRSLLGHITELLDYLQVLYAAVGIPHDPDSGQELTRMTSDLIIRELLQLPTGVRLSLLAPVVIPGNTLDLRACLHDFLRQGFLRVRWNDDIVDIEDLLAQSLDSLPSHLSLVVDRIVLKGEESSARLADSMETAFRIHQDEVHAFLQFRNGSQSLRTFYTRYRNPETGFVLPNLTPKHFSFNSPQGFCPHCQGLGVVSGSSVDPHSHQAVVCSICHGKRLNRVSAAVTLKFSNGCECNLPDLLDFPLARLNNWLGQLIIPPHLAPVISRLQTELDKRMTCLNDLGLGYLCLSRPASSLSGGELQRAKLATQLGCGLSGVLYILDEPTIGLHPQDSNRLIHALKNLRDLGNTVLVIEHDEQLLREADLLIDMGPGSGPQGGQILCHGTPEQLQQFPNSITGPWLSGKRVMPVPVPPRTDFSSSCLVLKDATANNLQHVDLHLPIGAFTCLSGPSGSGKSTLVMQCLIPALKQSSGNNQKQWGSLSGAESLSQVRLIDQSPIGSSPRSTPATASGLLNVLRPLYANLPLSKQRGYSPSRFSTNVRGGRCERCLGSGFIEVDLQFLGKSLVPCDACQGQRYNRETLEVTWRGRSIAQLLSLSVDEALELLEPIPKAASILRALQKTGLGYLALDRPAYSLSGGEAQRVKISTELAKASLAPGVSGSSLIILDEPSTGLHFQETALLIQALYDLRQAGHTILCIEHNLDILASADFIIDMGPGAGELGGKIVDQGTPQDLALRGLSPTSHWLRNKLNL